MEDDMSMVEERPDEVGQAPAAAGVRGKTEIGFPYDDLDAAIEIVRVAHDNYGGRCDADQAAAVLNQKPGSGAFRSKIGAARTFGLIGPKRGEIEVTDLGRRVLDARSSDAARAEAFLNVPLFSALYDAFRGTTLPGSAGLEERIKGLRVPVKQARHARLVFQRSARQAGFFKAAPDRLVRPPAGGVVDVQTDDEREDEQETGRRDDETGTTDIGRKPAIITELFRRLPDDGGQFDGRARTLWMAAFMANLDLVYGPADEEEANGTATDRPEPVTRRI